MFGATSVNRFQVFEPFLLKSVGKTSENHKGVRMSASIRLKCGKANAVKGDLANQSRAIKEVTLITRRNAVTAPGERSVLTDVTNCSSLKTPSWYQSDIKELDETQREMKKRQIATPIRASARIITAKAHKNESNTWAKENTNRRKASSVTLNDDDNEHILQTKDPVTKDQSFSKRAKNRFLVFEEDKQEDGQNHTQESDPENNPVPIENSPKKRLAKAVNLRKTSEQPTRQSKRLKANKKTEHSESEKAVNVAEIDESITRSSTYQAKGKTNSQIASKESPEDTYQLSTETEKHQKLSERTAQTLKDLVTSEGPQYKQRSKVKQPIEALKHSSTSKAENMPGSPVASSSKYKSPGARRTVRQPKLTIQNQKLSIDTTKNSSGTQSKKVTDAEPERRTSKRVYKKNASLSSSPKSAGPNPTTGSPEAMKANQPGSRAKKKVQSKINSMLSSPKFRSPASSPKSSPARKDASSSLKKSIDGKKAPIWKSEPKPEPLRSAPDDVYNLEYDPKDVKQKKKRQRRPKSAEPAKRTKKARVEPDNLPPIELKLPEKLALKSKTVEKPPSPRMESLPPNETYSAEELASSPERPCSLVLNESVIGPSAGGLPASTPININTRFANEQPSMPFDPITPIVETRVEVPGIQVDADISASEVQAEQPKSKLAPPPLDLDNCFGFGVPEEEPQLSLVRPEVTKSTPIKAPQARANTPFRPSLSPVRNVVNVNKKSTASRPARLDRELARDIIGIHAASAAHDKKKQKTLKEFIEEAEPRDRSVDEEQPVYCPPTPPTVFSAPARRSYSKREMRKIKKTMFKEHEDVEDNEHHSAEEEQNDENDDSNSSERKRKKKAANKKPKKTKQQKELEEWAKMTAAHFNDIEKSELILSD